MSTQGGGIRNVPETISLRKHPEACKKKSRRVYHNLAYYSPPLPVLHNINLVDPSCPYAVFLIRPEKREGIENC
jgi:hypothetical protein